MKVHQFGLCLFALVFCTLISHSKQAIALMPTSVTTVMASREMRYHHFVWHNIRNMWNSLSATTQAQIRSYGWAPPRPAQDRYGKSLTDNNSGEDFLYMHRMMINKVNTILRQNRYANVSGFPYLLDKNDAKFPMPKNYTGPNENLDSLVKYYKSDAWLVYARKVEARLNDTKFMQSMTLGQLGSFLEFASDVHQGLHFRYSQVNALMRVKTSAPIPNIDPKYDVNTSMWLVDLYCSQANPWFWKVHGWVDNQITKWQVANGIKEIQWKGTWTGGNMSSLPSNLNIGVGQTNARFLGKDMADMNMQEDDHDCFNHKNMNLTVLEHIASLLAQEGKLCNSYNDLAARDDESYSKIIDCPNSYYRLK